MDISIIQSVLNVFTQYGENIRLDIEKFENALNDEAPQLLDECYLIVQGIKLDLLDAMIFDEDLDNKSYVDFLTNEKQFSEEEALFMVGVFKAIVNQMGYYFEIPQLEDYLKNAYQKDDYRQLFLFAHAYFDGFGVSQDYSKAFEIYQYLYQQGILQSAYYLGYMYEYGYGVEQDISKALDYFYQSQDSQTYYHLGKMYMFGQHVDRDEEKAFECFDKSHDPLAYYYQGLLCEERRDWALAFEKYYEGAKLFQVECLYKVAMFLRRGLGVDLNLIEAKKYFQYAYYLLHGNSAYELSMMYFDGISVEKDEKKAMRYLTQAASLNSIPANQTLAHFYELGMHVKKNYTKAIEYMQRAQELEKEESHENI